MLRYKCRQMRLDPSDQAGRQIDERVGDQFQPAAIAANHHQTECLAQGVKAEGDLTGVEVRNRDQFLLSTTTTGDPWLELAKDSSRGTN